jgi:hypothetical protein
MRPPILKVFPGPAIPTGLAVATGPKTRKPAGRGTHFFFTFSEFRQPDRSGRLFLSRRLRRAGHAAEGPWQDLYHFANR